MATGWQRVTGASARALIAHRLATMRVDAALGAVVLAPHQVVAAERLLEILKAHRGALLADDVGMGKTFIALAVAAHHARVLILHPAALRSMWLAATARAGVQAGLVSYEALSRGDREPSPCDLVILDEAHHARSRDARRYARIAALTAQAHVLLLSATPVPNRPDELHALLALFLGERAASLDAAGMRELVVRRTTETVPGARLPVTGEVTWLNVPDDEDLLARLVALPPPVASADSGDGGILLTYGLVRLWASSRAALAAAVRRRIARASALAQSLAAGWLPTDRVLSSWTLSGTAMQLAIPELLVSTAPGGAPQDAAALLDSIQAHRSGLLDVAATLHRGPDPDASRATVLAELRSLHPGEKILAFTEYAETAQAYWRRMRSRAGVAMLTSRGGAIASGRVSRADVLDRFAPLGQRRGAPRRIEEISLLITTDLLAEGVDLRDATVIVHLDLPWSPARLEQRVGRARRLGSSAGRIAVYALRPPKAADALLTMESRLRTKVAAAHASVGWPRAMPSPAERQSATRDRIARWRVEAHDADSPRCAIGFLTAPEEGWLALVRVGGAAHLVACVDRVTGDAPDLLERAVDIAESAPDADGAAEDVAQWCRTAAQRWADARAAESAVMPPPDGGVTRRLLRRIDRIHAGMPHDVRAAVAPLLARSRGVAVAPRSAGIEHVLDRLARDDASDGPTWLRAVAQVDCATVASAPDARVEVLLVFGPCR